MKLKLLLILSCFMCACSLKAESCFIAEITDMLGNEGYEIMTRKEYRDAAKEVMDEKRIFSRIVRECKQEWKKSFEMISGKMEEKLGRPVPDYGFERIAPSPGVRH
ncbi:MAG: hypothetical protein R6V06_05185 [Kiritimatiellia bacterium]